MNPLSEETLPATAAEQEWLRAVGLRVKVGRVRTGESQLELALRSGVGRTTVGSVERAEHPTSVLVLSRLGAAIGVPIGELLAPGEGHERR